MGCVVLHLQLPQGDHSFYSDRIDRDGVVLLEALLAGQGKESVDDRHTTPGRCELRAGGYR